MFADLGLSEPELHLAKAQLVAQIARTIREMGITQTAAAERMGIDQPKVSALLRGHFKDYSIERLTGFLNSLGHGVQIVVKERQEGEKAGLEVVTA